MEVKQELCEDLVLILTDDGPIMGYVNLKRETPIDKSESIIMRNPVIVLFQNEAPQEGQSGVSISLKGFMPYPIGRVMNTDALVSLFTSEIKNVLCETWIDPSLVVAYNNQFNKIQVVSPNEMGPSMDHITNQQKVAEKANPFHVVKN